MQHGDRRMSESSPKILGKSTVKVTYKYVDGAHFFTSTDKAAEGLCVAHKDLGVAFNEVGVQLKLLYKHNHGLETNFSPPLPFDVFKHYIETAITGAEEYVNEGLITPSSIQPWMINASAENA